MKNQFAKNKVREVLPIYKMDIFRKYSKWALIPGLLAPGIVGPGPRIRVRLGIRVRPGGRHRREAKPGNC